MKRRMISGLALTLVLTSGALGAPKSTQNPQAVSDGQIRIRIRDYAQADPLVLRHAEQVANEILQKAGVATRWIECPVGSATVGDCASPVSTLDFVVNLLPQSMSDRLRLPGAVFGSALEGTGKDFGFIASVFYDVAKDRAAKHQVSFGDLLGNAIAHELGHLLLGTRSHSGWSLMSASWSGNQFQLAAQGGLAFSEPEVKRIQASMSARTQAVAKFTGQGSLATLNSSE